MRAGESVVLLDRGTPVARLEPIAARPDPSGRLLRLERAGILRVGSAPPPIDLLRSPGPSVAGGGSVVATLLDERRSGR